MKYRKLPVVIDAMELTFEDREEVAIWSGGLRMSYGLQIKTLEGSMKASWGDWIIKGVHDEFYPCKPDIFKETYEKVK